MKSNRVFFVEVLGQILDGECSFSDVKSFVPEQERAFANMLLLTSLRKLTFIKQEIFPLFIKKKIPHKQKILETILYLAITELLFLHTPDYAVVSSYTEIAKKNQGNFSGNFVNAILRNIIIHRDELLKKKNDKYFSENFSKILRQDYNSNQIAQMERFAGIEPPLNLTIKNNVSLDIKNAFLLPSGSLRLPANTQIKTIPGFEEGLWWVQDVSASIAVKCLSSLQGKRILDLCAAPGGKTAQLLDAGAFVTAVDISSKRMDKLVENIKRLQFTQNLKTFVADATSFQTNEKFDIILIDAPCSATGTYRRHPEIMHTKSLEDVVKQADLQTKILNHAIEFLSVGGFIVYVTCSLAKLEGEKQMHKFVMSHPEFSIVPIDLSETSCIRTSEGFLRILPGDIDETFGNDGFFVAILQRKS